MSLLRGDKRLDLILWMLPTECGRCQVRLSALPGAGYHLRQGNRAVRRWLTKALKMRLGFSRWASG